MFSTKTPAKFASSFDAYVALKAQIEKEMIDADQKLNDRTHWQDVNDYVYRAAIDAQKIVDSIDQGLPTHLFVERCRELLVDKADDFSSFDDPSSYYIPTLYSVIRVLD